MINGLPVKFAQVAPINHDEMFLPKVVHSKNLPQSCQPGEKATFKGALVC